MESELHETPTGVNTEHFVALICENQYLKVRLDRSLQEGKRWKKHSRNSWKALKILNAGMEEDLNGRKHVLRELLESLDSSRAMEKEIDAVIRSFQEEERELVRLRMNAEIWMEEKQSMEVELHHIEQEFRKLVDENDELRRNLSSESARSARNHEEDLQSIMEEQQRNRTQNERLKEIANEKDEQNLQLNELVTHLESNRKALLFEKEKSDADKKNLEELLTNAKVMMDRLQEHYKTKDTEYHGALSQLRQNLTISEQRVAELELKLEAKRKPSKSNLSALAPKSRPLSSSTIVIKPSLKMKTPNLSGLPKSAFSNSFSPSIRKTTAMHI
eukprot:TRINITY_DN22793_c0_g1_i1.p1 TRINITY_DN22793_c0_g1~~TRINITY_DN22793_c0_g1_i1.p1  ORF type:complete len:331 (-),score=65.01 TRINITY_DN22793_c0_g1_i1:27-1019(-)